MPITSSRRIRQIELNQISKKRAVRRNNLCVIIIFRSVSGGDQDIPIWHKQNLCNKLRGSVLFGDLEFRYNYFAFRRIYGARKFIRIVQIAIRMIIYNEDIPIFQCNHFNVTNRVCARVRRYFKLRQLRSIRSKYRDGNPFVVSG